jgi:hypothetical protein
LMLMGFIAGQAVALHHFLNVGRGDYAAAVARMLAVPETEMPVRVGGSQDYRISMMTRYFAMRSGQGDDLIYVDEASSMPVTWYVQEDRLGGATFPLNLDVARAGSSSRFERVEVFPHWGLSGQSWALYRATP